MTVTVRLTAATSPLFTAATTLFDEYRQHYGANPAPEAVAAWMLEQVLSARARIYVACEDTPDGMARPDGGSAAHAASGRAAEAASIRDLPNARDLGPGERPSAADFDGGSAGSGGAGSGAVPGAPLEPGRGPVAYGICSVAVVPAALTLRTVWVIRDLFVVRAARHRGHARALLAHVAREARTAGAHRLSLQTETANVRAIELYAKNGFDVLTDVAIMDRLL